uniref:G-protein coupled receptors family 1 profile domain-containing protein n=1 Tax=Acrobeloides nanus TaxID=290746 RepID=A0A914DK60_9BILA
MNLFVIYHMQILRRRDKEQFRNGIGICLFVMAITGLVTLFTLAFNFVFSICAPLFSPTAQTILCKVIFFTSHAAYSQSMWVWLLMSTLRYIATRKPLQYTTLYRLPYMAMTSTMIGSIVENSYLLFVVEGSDYGCVLDQSIATRVYKIFDVIMSFAIPTLLIPCYKSLLIGLMEKRKKWFIVS